MKRGCQVCNKLHVDLQKHFITTCMLWFWVKPFGATFIKIKFRNLNNITVVVCFHQCLKTENTKIKKNCHTCQDYWKKNCNYLMNLNISFKTSFIYQHTFWKVLLTIGPFRQNTHAAWRIVKEVCCSTRRDTPKINHRSISSKHSCSLENRERSTLFDEKRYSQNWSHSMEAENHL